MPNSVAHEHPTAAAAAKLEQSVTRLGGGFMAHPSLLAAGTPLGYESNDFYYAGRVGVLGEISAPVAVAALVFFAPQRVEPAWQRSADIQPRSAAALLYGQCAAEWGHDHYVDDVDWQRIADDAGRVIESTSVASAPIFAGWISMPDPDTPKARAQHRLNALREYRMAIHGAAIIAAGVSVGDAVRHAAPQHVGLFGWPPEFDADPDDVAELWQGAEAVTNRIFGNDLAVLGDDLGGFVDRCGLACSAVFPSV